MQTNKCANYYINTLINITESLFHTNRNSIQYNVIIMINDIIMFTIINMVPIP